MPVLDTLAQLYVLHELGSYARMTRPGARARHHLAHDIPPDGTCSAQQHVRVLQGVVAWSCLRGRQTPQERFGATNRPRPIPLPVSKLVVLLSQRCVPTQEVPR